MTQETHSFMRLSVLGLFLLISLVLALFIGAYQAPLSSVFNALILHPEADSSLKFLVWSIRVPRVLLAGCVGAGLATAGAAIQGLFRNPLADPTLIGINSGAMLFAALSILFMGTFVGAISGFWYQASISVFAFVGGVLTSYLVYQLAREGGRTLVMKMLLAGIAISAFAAALTGLCIYVSDDQQMRDLTFWTLGSFNNASWDKLGIALPVTVVGIVFLQPMAKALNSIMLGEREAVFLGIHVERVKTRVIFLSAMMIGICIAFSGIIGFVGLMIPHLIRILRGSDYQILLRASALLGASFMIWADLLSRTIIAPAELPVGILTAMTGAPFFLWILMRSQRERIAI
ncbi:MAG: iron ABC transporter permease [Bacteroidota bacterium]